GQLGPLGIRLGPRATVDDPMFGRATGMPGIDAHLKSTADWLTKGKATYDRGQFTTGVDRDITEGIVTLEEGEPAKKIEVPVAVVAERRRSREVELRVYWSTRLLTGKASARKPLVGSSV